jgi:VWFA-related protein
MKRVLLALLSIPLLGAAPQRPTAGESIDVAIVNVDVFVTDRAGNRVYGLKKDDFEIFENGVRQPISHFAAYNGRETGTVGVEAGADPVAEAAPAPPPRQRRVIAVFVERFRLPQPLAEPVFASMKKLLRDTVRPGDAVTVVTWNDRRLTTLQAYTDDLAAIEKAIDAVAKQTVIPMRDTFAMERAERDDIEDFQLSAEEYAKDNGMLDVAAALREADEDMKTASARAAAKRDFREIDLKVRTINALLRSMSGFDGRRALLLATHRMSGIAGAEHYWASGSDAMIDSVDRIELDTRRIIKSLYDTANANGVAVYPMFAEGLQAAPPVSAEGSHPVGDIRSIREGSTSSEIRLPNATHTYEYLIQDNETPALKEIAKKTGGLAAWGSADVSKLLNVIRDDFDSYYSLAYRATSRSVDKSRRVVVKTRREDLTVRSRGEVVEKSDTRRMKDRIVGALFRESDPGARLAFAATFGKSEKSGRKVRIPVKVRIPISALYAAPSGTSYGGAFAVYVAWGSKVGGVSDAIEERRTFTIPAAELARAQQSFFTYDFDLAVNDTTERIALGVADVNSKEYGVRVFDVARLLRAALAARGTAGRQ